jgi:hypothetical protein
MMLLIEVIARRGGDVTDIYDLHRLLEVKLS